MKSIEGKVSHIEGQQKRKRELEDEKEIAH
jgi:hypothetical protein